MNKSLKVDLSTYDYDGIIKHINYERRSVKVKFLKMKFIVK